MMGAARKGWLERLRQCLDGDAENPPVGPDALGEGNPEKSKNVSAGAARAGECASVLSRLPGAPLRRWRPRSTGARERGATRSFASCWSAAPRSTRAAR
jgi:hypothetical protein